MNPRNMQQFAGVEIANPSDQSLIEQGDFDGRLPRMKGRVKLLFGDRQRVGPELILENLPLKLG